MLRVLWESAHERRRGEAARLGGQATTGLRRPMAPGGEAGVPGLPNVGPRTHRGPALREEDGAALLSQPDVHPKGFEPLTF